MKILLSGEIDGKIKDFYEKATHLVGGGWGMNTLPEWVLCTGSFGTWPDAAHVDRGTRQNAGVGDFARLYVEGWQAPLQTVYVAGVHEDHQWLKKRQAAKNMEVLNNVHWLATGFKTNIGNWDENIRVTGFGKVYSETTFNGTKGKRSQRHYTRQEFEKACSSGPTDILLFHERPTNKITHQIIFATQPKLIVYSAKQVELSLIMNIPAIGLGKQEVYLFDTKDLKKG